MAYELSIGNCTYAFDNFTEYNISMHNIKGLTNSEKIEFLDALLLELIVQKPRMALLIHPN